MEHTCNANTQETEKEESQVKGQPRGKRDGLVVKSTNGSSKDQVQFQVPILWLKKKKSASPVPRHQKVPGMHVVYRHIQTKHPYTLYIDIDDDIGR